MPEYEVEWDESLTVELWLYSLIDSIEARSKSYVINAGNVFNVINVSYKCIKFYDMRKSLFNWAIKM